MVDDATFNAFISDFKQFQGQMLEFKSTTERRLYDNGLKLTQIEKEMQAPRLCPSHESMLTMIASTKNGEARQNTTNINVDAEQKTQNKDIIALEKKTDIQEFKLNWKQETQLNVASFGTVIIFIIQVAEWVLSNWGK